MNDCGKTKEQLIEELTELRRRVSALEEAERSRPANERLAVCLIEAAPLGILECDAEGRITFANPSQEAITGYPAAEMVGTRIWDRLESGPLKDSLPGYLKQLILEQPPPVPYFNRSVKKCGEVYDIRVDWDYRRDEQDRVVGFVFIVSNITQQKRLEEELRKSAERYRLLTESTTDMIYIADRSGDILYANQSAAAFIRCDANNIVGKGQAELFPPEMVQRHIATITKVFQTGEVFEDDGVYRFGAEEVWLNSRIMPLRNERGEIVSVMGVSRNVTDRKRAESALQQAHAKLEQRVAERTAELAEANRALQQSHDELKTIYDQMTDGIVIIDIERAQFVRVNSAFCLMLGRSAEDACSATAEQINPFDALPELRRHFEAIKRGEIARSESVPLIRPDGSEVYADVVSSPIQYNQRSCWISFFHDVTERKRTEEAIIRAKREWERTFDSVPDLIAVLDRSFRIVRVNRTMAERLGREPEQCIGLKCYESIHGLHHPPDFCPNALTLKSGKGHSVEMREVRLGGDFLVTTTPIFDDNDRLVGSIHVARDITERKRAEEALRQSEEKYRGLIDICPDTVLVTDLTGKTLFVSKEAWRLLDVPEQTDLLGRNTFDYLIEPDRPRLAANYVELLTVGKRGYTEYTVLRPNGTTVPVELSSVLIRDAEGNTIGSMAIIRDISERKQAQEELRQSEEKYRGLVEICPDTVVVTDLTAKATFVSRQAWELLALPEQEPLVGKNVFEFVVEADRPRLAANITNLIEAGWQRHMEYTALRLNGETVPIELSSALIRDGQGKPKALLAVIRDISERKQAEQTLQQHYRELRAIYDGMADGLVILDLETTRCIRVNQSLCKMLGYSEEELKALPPDSLHSPEMLPKMQEKYQAIVEGLASHTEDVPFVRKDGSIVYVDITSDQITYNGRPSVIHLLRDTTERKLAQETLKKEHRTLKHLLQSSDHERQLISYEIHDGLAQQLAGAIMQLETFAYQKDHKPKDAVKAFEAAITMLRQAHFEARRLISGVRPPILDESGIIAAVAHLVNEHRLQKGPKIELRSSVSFDRLVPIMENAIYRIVQEGLANACRHSQSPKICVELQQHGDSLRIRVQDWGIGFDPDKVKDDRFGLEGIRERARLLGGSATLKSASMQGTCIIVDVPLALLEQ
jgi:PAS domain S-box-containing protein